MAQRLGWQPTTARCLFTILRSEEHMSELQSLRHLVCRLLLSLIFTLFPYTTLFRSNVIGAWIINYRELAFPRSYVDYSANGNQISAEVARSCAGGCSVRSWRSGLAGNQQPPDASSQSLDRKSTCLNSSHLGISYAVFFYLLFLLSFPTRRSSDLMLLVLG